jgi:hypothetical protein
MIPSLVKYNDCNNQLFYVIGSVLAMVCVNIIALSASQKN